MTSGYYAHTLDYYTLHQKIIILTMILFSSNLKLFAFNLKTITLNIFFFYSKFELEKV